MGTAEAEEICRECGAGSGKSGKVAIFQGEMTSDVCIEQTQAILSVFAKHPEIKVVSNQGTSWDANKAHDLAAVVLKQHPDLCAAVGYWQGADLGFAQAVKESGLMGKVRVYSSGEITPPVCAAIREGKITKYWNYDAFRQGHDVMTATKFLLQLGEKPGSHRLALYSHMDIMTKENVDNYNCWAPSMELVKKLISK